MDAFSLGGQGTYIFVGNWDASEYGRELRQKFNLVPGLKMLDPIYDKDTLADLRTNCDFYLHGHSVGGTNPSLVEMLFYDCEILAFDCVFNRHTAGDFIKYFKDSTDLTAQLKLPKRSQLTNRSSVRNRYTQANISENYICLVEKLIRTEKR